MYTAAGKTTMLSTHASVAGRKNPINPPKLRQCTEHGRSVSVRFWNTKYAELVSHQRRTHPIRKKLVAFAVTL